MLSCRIVTDNHLIPRNIRCPKCNSRHYAIRVETKHYMEDGEISITCHCGCKYKVINRGRTSIIRKVSTDG